MRAPQPATPSIPIINRLNLLRIKVYLLLKCNIKGIGKKPSHYTGIKLDSLIIALCPKLCRHNSSDPNGEVMNLIQCLQMISVCYYEISTMQVKFKIFS